METVDYQNLQAIVSASDIAIRVASQLRVWSATRVTVDRAALDQAIIFLDRASNGGSFMAGKQAASAKFGNTLQPLNWATDTYFLVSTPAASNDAPDYGVIARYLDQLGSTLQGVVSGSKVENPQVEAAISFFNTLGELLGSRADQHMRTESFQLDANVGA